MTPRLLTVREVAGRLRLTPTTVRTLAREGSLPAFRVGAGWRFRPSEIDRWLEAQRPDLEESVR